MTDERRKADDAESANVFQSSACGMNEAPDSYMGYAERDELAAFLNEMLEAERAGARVTLETARTVDDVDIANLVQAIHRDEARWCAMLIGYLQALGIEPSAKTGAFYGKAMAIEALPERLDFLNRGQGWVVKKLREILPRIRDDRMHADFREMLDSHIANIALAEAARSSN